MTLGRYLWGVLLVGIVFVPLVAGARTLRRLLLPTFAGALARLGEAILGLSIVVVVAQVLGLADRAGARQAAERIAAGVAPLDSVRDRHDTLTTSGGR